MVMWVTIVTLVKILGVFVVTEAASNQGPNARQRTKAEGNQRVIALLLIAGANKMIQKSEQGKEKK